MKQPFLHCRHRAGRIALAGLCLAVLGQATAFAGVKYWDNPDFKAFDVGDYVQDGLVLNYDGIRNAGVDANHDPNAMTWVNLGTGGSAYNMARYSTNGTKDNSNAATESAWNNDASKGYWTDCGFAFSKNAVFHELTAFTVPTTYTIQILVNATAGDQNGIGYVMCDYNAANWAQCSLGIRTSAGGGTPNNSVYLVSSQRPYFAASSASAPISYATAIHDGAKGAMFSGTKAPWNATDGSYRADLGTGPYNRANGISIGGHYPRTDELFKGTVKSFRFYAKCLSDDDVAWNRVVDEARYFHRRGAIPVTNVVVSTAIDGVADDHFAIDAEGYTFTAPAQRTFEGRRYVLGGYTLETWNGSAWVADGEGTHSGSAVALSDPTALVRVTWQYSRPAGEGRLAHYDVGDYVTDGLMLFYDGIRNQGADAPHSYSATTWVNIGNGSGDSQDWTLGIKHKVTTGDIGEWNDDGYMFKGFSDFQKMGNSFSIPVSHTIQTLIDASIDEQYWKTAQAYVYATAWDKSSLALRTKDDTPKVNSFYWVTQGGSYRTYILNGSGRYDYATAIQDGDAKTTAFFAGVTPPTTGGLADGFKQYDSELSSASVANIFLGGMNSDKDMFTGKLKFFRYYPNKALSPAEVAQNRKVDEYRYFGRYVVTNVLVQSTYSYLDGNEKAGPYEVDGSYTFTAPETVTAPNGITYACDGYTVETQDGIGWAALTSGAGNSYLYNTSAGTVRLTWKWKATSGLRSAADYSFDDLSPAGLALHYDGLLNQGVGVARSTTSTKWINLGSRPGMDLSRATSGSDTSKHGHWGDDGYVFTGNAQFGSASGQQWATTFSAQALVDAKYADNTHVSGNYIAATTWSRFGMQIDGSRKVGRFNAQNDQDYAHRPNYPTETGIDYMTAIHDAATQTAVVFPGTKAPTGGAVTEGYMHFDTFDGVENNQLRLGGWGGGPGGSQNLVGTMKTFRYYDRVLTEEELIRNRNVDAVRYFDALAITNVVVAVEAGSGINPAETAGEAYFVEGSHSFTAKGTAGIGYRLSVPDGNGGWTTLRSFTEGGSYTYDKADPNTPECVKLEWRVQKPFVLVVR